MIRLLSPWAACLVFLGLLVSSGSKAQSPEDWRKTEQKTMQKLTNIGGKEYQGVVPGKGNMLPRVEELRGKVENYVTWPGFQRTPAGSRIFIQSTRPIGYERKDGKKKLTLVLNECHIFLRNNKNPLVTSHFTFTPVRRAYLKQTRKKGEKKVELVIELRAESTPQISQYTDSDGYNYTFIDFPVGNYAPPKPREEEEIDTSGIEILTPVTTETEEEKKGPSYGIKDFE